ncbi:hypothetical protein LSG31_01275 [Fodinisporobacter ferrooxydans]|uniref:GDT1 family protein n=1 Tax=Fodinisporobacter ferrooxydans TaxID=2901836 RepID=A0ABY4CLS8_9BACL|nr:hypothetical protein LSG31_01275 [Alicyclobacillaceae bacterium MYW30-H2]
MNVYAIGASFLGTAVEFVEALTIILAVGAIRGWKSSLLGALSAVAILSILVAVIGTPLTTTVQVFWVQALIGLLMLLFGIRWLRKAILRYSGLKALHNEEESFQEEVERQRKAGIVSPAIDRFAFTTTFSGTFLEGLEAIFIVITFGLSAKSIQSSILGGILAVVVVIGLGIALRGPLTKIPENTMKFIVGVMLTSFGAFWIGEGLGVSWPQKDVSILYMAATLCLFSWIEVAHCKRQLNTSSQSNSISIGVN